MASFVMRYSPSLGSTTSPSESCIEYVEITKDPILISTYLETNSSYLDIGNSTNSTTEIETEIQTIHIKREHNLHGETNCGTYFTVIDGRDVSVKLIQTSNNDSFSYVLMENLDTSNGTCGKKYTLIPLASNQCSLSSVYAEFILHIQNTDVLVKLMGSESFVDDCNDTKLSEDKCAVKYDAVTEALQPYPWYPYFYFPIEPCHETCLCKFSHREWLMTCDNFHTTNFLVYEADIQTLDLRFIGLNEIKPFAFLELHLDTLYLQENRIKILENGVFFGLFTLQKLYLENNFISTLADGVFLALNQLWYLSLDGNKITHLSSGTFKGLVNLQFLYLSDNQIDTLDQGVFANMGKLVRFLLRYNGFTEIHAGAFVGLGNLSELYLEVNALRDLPSGIFQGLSSLHILRLDYNEIKTLSSNSFSELTNLGGLFLGHNQIDSLPDDVFRKLTRLSAIELKNNLISTISERIFTNLTQLEIIDLRNNNLTSTHPNAFKGLAQLRRLYLQQNNLTTLSDDALEGAVNLIFLMLQDNQITSLPATLLHGMTNLDTLNLQNNNITLLSAGTFRDCSKLADLIISHNVLSILEPGALDGIGSVHGPGDRCYTYTDLHFEDNRVTSLPRKLFTGIKCLLYLYLHMNRLNSIVSGSFDGLYQLRELRLEHNFLHELPIRIFDDLSNVWYISLHYNYIKTLPHYLFENTTELRKLLIAHNHLHTLPSSSFKGVTKMYELNLTNNHLIKVPADALAYTGDLQSLDISYNKISELPETCFAFLHNLYTLHLNENNLSHLPGNIFRNLTNLKIIDLSSNSLIEITDSVWQSAHNLQLVNISYNNLSSFPPFQSAESLLAYDISNNVLTTLHPHAFLSMFSLSYLTLDNNLLKEIPVKAFKDLLTLETLYLGRNLLQHIEYGTFSALTSLKTLDVSNNLLSKIHSEFFLGLLSIEYIQLHHNKIKRLPMDVFHNLTQVKFVNISYNSIQAIDKDIISTRSIIDTFDLRYNGLYLVEHASFLAFKNMDNLTVLVDNFATCCFSSNPSNCIPQSPKPVYLTCRRMLDNIGLRLSMWILGLFAVFWNAFVFFLRCSDTKSNKVQTILILNLSLSDFLMGVSMVVLASADAFYAEFFPSFSEQWRNGPLCKLVSILSLLSSEASVFFIVIISFDRFQGANNPFSTRRLRPHHAKFVCATIWLIWIVISVIPLALSSISERFVNTYEVSEVCAGIPIVKRPVDVKKTESILINQPELRVTFEQVNHADDTTSTELKSITTEQKTVNSSYITSEIVGEKLATYYSIIIFIGINLVCFIFIAILYIQIFNIARRSAQKAGRKQKETDELRMAVKMSAIVLTDFFTWVPLVIVCILAQCSVINVPPVLYAWTVAFILPFNSAINPFLYTLIDRKKSQTKPKLKLATESSRTKNSDT